MPNFNTLKLLRGAASVLRAHTRRTIHRQTVGEHTFGAMSILFYIKDEPNIDLVRAMLHHDVPEYVTGDVPSPTKGRYPALKHALNAAEQDILWRYGLSTDSLIPEDQRLLDYCDIMELAMFACEEIDMGNHYMTVILRRCLSALVERKLVDVTATARELYQQIRARSDELYPPHLGESSLHHIDD